jgi:prolyl-tRNA synthetase
MKTAYERIYARCELETFGADAFSGAMGGRQSVEFVTRCEAGEDEVLHCSTFGYTPNMEVVTLGPAPELAQTAERVIAQLAATGVDVLYDDRDVRAGVKLKDADLIGIPIRIAISPRSLAQDAVEWKLRGAREAPLVPIAEVRLAQG